MQGSQVFFHLLTAFLQLLNAAAVLTLGAGVEGVLLLLVFGMRNLVTDAGQVELGLLHAFLHAFQGDLGFFQFVVQAILLGAGGLQCFREVLFFGTQLVEAQVEFLNSVQALKGGLVSHRFQCNPAQLKRARMERQSSDQAVTGWRGARRYNPR